MYKKQSSTIINKKHYEKSNFKNLQDPRSICFEYENLQRRAPRVLYRDWARGPQKGDCPKIKKPGTTLANKDKTTNPVKLILEIPTKIN